MSQRRDFIRAVSTLPLAALAGGNAAQSQTLRQIKIPQPPPKTSPADFSAEAGGAPDPGMNLFGIKRPSTWREVQQLVVSGLSSHPGSTQIKEWMDTFSLTFDQQARKIVVDANSNLLMSPDDPKQFRYEPYLYESTLRTAASQLDRCLAYHNEMGEYEIAGISAGLSYLTFLNVSPIQLSLLRATNNADIETLERENNQLTIDNYNGLDNTSHAAVDTIYIAGLRQDAQGALSEADVRVSKENERTAHYWKGNSAYRSMLNLRSSHDL